MANDPVVAVPVAEEAPAAPPPLPAVAVEPAQPSEPSAEERRAARAAKLQDLHGQLEAASTKIRAAKTRDEQEAAQAEFEKLQRAYNHSYYVVS